MSRTALIIEDDDLLREIYATKLEMEGFTVITARDGREGLEKAAAYDPPDIILLDMVMPHMNGLEFLETYQPKNFHPPIAILVMSNKSSIHEVTRAKALGALEYLIKAQHTPDDIMARIRSHLPDEKA
ncbi:MAG: DNA-binding response regulator VicR [Patescibacteria group bacterium]|nr:DNA-binding response regulator VicR [Patescibacteria group bacterium]